MTLCDFAAGCRSISITTDDTTACCITKRSNISGLPGITLFQRRLFHVGCPPPSWIFGSILGFELVNWPLWLVIVPCVRLSFIHLFISFYFILFIFFSLFIICTPAAESGFSFLCFSFVITTDILRGPTFLPTVTWFLPSAIVCEKTGYFSPFFRHSSSNSNLLRIFASDSEPLLICPSKIVSGFKRLYTQEIVSGQRAYDSNYPFAHQKLNLPSNYNLVLLVAPWKGCHGIFHP